MSDLNLDNSQATTPTVAQSPAAAAAAHARAARAARLNEARDEAKAKAKTDAGDEKLIRVVIPKTKDEVRDVYLNVNFKAYLIKRGVPVDLPESVVNAMKETTETKYFKEIDPQTQREILVPQQTQTTPFNYA